MKGFSTASIFTVLGIAALVAGMFLPLWSKNGVTVTAWEGEYLSFGRWMLLLAGLGSLVPVFVKSLRPTYWQLACALVICLEACLVFWKGYKLGAMGMGAGCLLLGGMLMGLAGVWHRWGK